MPTNDGSLRTKPYRLALLAGIVCIIPFGYGVRFSTALNAPLLQDIVGSLAYQVLLMMVVAFICPRLSFGKCAVGVFIASSAIEFLQLFDVSPAMFRCDLLHQRENFRVR